MELFAHAWASWIVFAIICGILEVVTPSFTFSFAAIGALAAALVSFKFGGIAQSAVFGIVTLLSVLILRPRLQRLFGRSSAMPSRAEALVGLKGTVVETIDSAASTGRVQVEGHDWAARSREKIEMNREIEVSGHDGIVLLVKEK